MKKILTLIFALIATISSGFAQDSEPDYLCFEVKAGTTILLAKNGNANPNIQYSFDKKMWSYFSELTVVNDCCMYFKGVNPNGFSTSRSDYSSFEVSDEFKCSGNIMALIDGVGVTTTIPSSSCFAKLFKDCPLTTAPELPATILADNCYDGMFSYCKSLTTAPKLPATTLADYCYYSMFTGCTSLTTAPELPATTLAGFCYQWMFVGCTSLTTAPKLPATTLADYCYYYMFTGCTSLTTAPKLPATTLARGCYAIMFEGCTSLTTAPELPATTLAEYCYEYMFEGCTSLTTAPELPATTLAENCYGSMFSGCTSLTTAPELPATTLAQSCYLNMFSECANLTTAPKLPATQLANSCYRYMFEGCTNLTTAPELPATTLAQSCYSRMFRECANLTTAPKLPATTLAKMCYDGMFKGCTSLTTAPELPATILADYCYQDMFSGCNQLQNISVAFNKWPENGFKEWVYNVSDKGVFFCPSDLPQQFGINYIPEGWQVVSSSTTINVSSQSEYVTIDKTSAKYNEKVNFSIADRTKDGYKLDKVLANNKEVAVSNYTGSLDMMDYLSDVNIQAIYSKITYTISTDDYSQANKVSATVDDDITITFKQRDGFDLVSATYNGNKLIVNNYKASFTMPAQDVEIKTVYNENNPKTPVSEIYSDNCAVSVFPNPAKSGEKITLKVGGKFDTNNTKIYIYNASGSLVMQIDDVQEYNQLTLRSGVYVGVFVTKGGKKTFRVAVK
ncbi:MAG: leucine-rich repeat protein [Bacteroidales bacterium]|nr:leucine-rich repeat protein [Bacteroidales bacterium]